MPELADQQRQDLAQATAQLAAAAQQFMTVAIPALQAMAEQFAQLHQHLTDVGLIDPDGKPTGPAALPPAPKLNSFMACPGCMNPVHSGISCAENAAILRSAYETD